MAYKHVIRAKTKNLFNKNNATIINGYIYSGQLIITESPVDRTIVFPCKPNTTYTFSKMYTNRLFMAETSEETPAIGTTCTNPIANLGEPPSQNYCTLTTTATAKNLIITVCALYNTVTYTLQEILDSVQIEEGSTPTPYTPYNYLQSNKRMIKVNDVCQLLDKSKFPATHTQLGCTFTNNGDGSFTINGTIQNGGSWSYPLQQITQNLYGHKILFVTKSTSGIVSGEMKFTLQNGSSKWGTYNSIYTVIYDDYKYIAIRIYMDNVDAGKTIDNATVKFQLFDLTEMYGAGHEPATVAEFRQRFPNEYYPYSPQCWLTSYKSAVVCKTKNLFDYKTTSTNNPIDWENVKLSLHEDYIELSGTQQPDKVIELGWDGFNIPFEVGKTYTLSADTKIPGFASMFMRAHYTDGQSPSSIWEAISWNLSEGTIRKIFTPTRPGYFDRLTFYNPPKNHFSGDYIFRVQLEQGPTATSYVPYQHL